MKTFTVWRDDRLCSIAELGLWDLLRLLLGHELPVTWVTPANPSVIRMQPNYDAFNLASAPEQVLDASEMLPPAQTNLADRPR